MKGDPRSNMSEVIKKPERIVSAIYFITSFFDERDPIKWKLRTLASEFISLTMSIEDYFPKEKEVTVLETKNLVLKIAGLLSVARSVGLVSFVNYDLMQEELMKYIDTLDSPISVSDLFNIVAPEIKMRELLGGLTVKDKNGYKSSARRQLPAISEKDKHLKKVANISVKKNTRQNTIISILRRKKEIMIKDISSLIDDCSEKTIQRELSAMVQSGVLRKEGEKRWSRYSLTATLVS